MASLHKDKRTGNWIIMFRWGGRQFRRSCETVSKTEAKELKIKVDQTTRLLKQGVLELPTDADPAAWIISAGRVSHKPRLERDDFGTICDDYLNNQHGKANTTMVTEHLHIGHLKKGLGEKTLLDQINLRKLQGYVSKRKVQGITIRKELMTFRQVWDWARSHKLTQRECPIYNNRRKWAVSLPKPAEKERFQTWSQIEKRIATGVYAGLKVQCWPA